MASGRRRPQSDPGFKAPSWFIPRSLPEGLALAAALGYGVTYFACALFYGPLGIEPADVGLGYADLLAQTAVYLATAFAFPVLILAVPMLVLPAARARWSAAWPTLAWTLAVVGFLVVNLLLLGWAFIDRGRIEDGKPAAGVLYLLPWSDSVVAHVAWTEGGGPALPTCVIRLGDAEGTEVLYDPSSSRTIRVPQSAVTVTIRPHSGGC
jgi:hypothetical protein